MLISPTLYVVAKMWEYKLGLLSLGRTVVINVLKQGWSPTPVAMLNSTY